MAMENNKRVLVIGIGGVSNGGKTTLAEGLNEFLQKDGVNVNIVHQDDYFKEEEELAWHESGEFRRWDELPAFNMDQMLVDTKKNIAKLEESGKLSVLIIEGILIFNHSDLDDLFSLRYLLTLTEEEARQRRVTRTYDPPDTANIFDYHVWPMYVSHLDQLRNRKIKMTELDGSQPKEKILQNVIDDMVALLQQ